MARDFAQSSSQYLDSIDAEIERLQRLRLQVEAAVQGDVAIGTPAKAVRKGMSAEGRRKIAEAQRARWAKQKKTGKPVAKAPTKKAAVKKPANRKASAHKAAATQANE